MSTRITVAVDSGGLKESNKQQILANRLAKLDSDAEQKLESRVKQTAEAAQPNTQPPVAAVSQKLRPQDEPAANREPVGVLLSPLAAPLGTTPTGGLLTASGLTASQLPGALRFKEQSCNFFVTSTSIVDPSQSIFSNFSPLPGKFSVQIPASKGLSIQTLGTLKGILTGGSRSFTLEAWLRLPSTPSSISSPAVFELGIAGQLFSSAVTRLCSVSIGLGDASQAFPAQPSVYWYGTRTDVSPPVNGEFFSVVNTDLVDGANDTVLPAFDAWNHFAIIMNADVLYWFINGKLYRTVSGIDSTCSDNVFGANPPQVEADFSPAFASYKNLYLFVSGIAYNSDALYFRGVRLTPQVRYSLTGFTPEHY